jgi:hypothetical protein
MVNVERDPEVPVLGVGQDVRQEVAHVPAGHLVVKMPFARFDGQTELRYQVT